MVDSCNWLAGDYAQAYVGKMLFQQQPRKLQFSSQCSLKGGESGTCLSLPDLLRARILPEAPSLYCRHHVVRNYMAGAAGGNRLTIQCR